MRVVDWMVGTLEDDQSTPRLPQVRGRFLLTSSQLSDISRYGFAQMDFGFHNLTLHQKFWKVLLHATACGEIVQFITYVSQKTGNTKNNIHHRQRVMAVNARIHAKVPTHLKLVTRHVVFGFTRICCVRNLSRNATCSNLLCSAAQLACSRRSFHHESVGLVVTALVLGCASEPSDSKCHTCS